MIIGPNGTGKSTLVCAICLGLGSKTSVLGRAKDMADFVKHGHKEAEIEVELAGKDGHTNPIIQHTIKRDGNKSSWRINGRQTTHKEVIALVRSYSIQIENLCQFLPQDRVVEFSSMTPEALLESTLKAAAPEQMSSWHMQLRQLGEQRLGMQSKNAEDANTLTNLEKRHAAQQHEVERIIERKALVIRLQGLEMAKPGIQYKEEKAKLDEMKKTKKQYEREFRDLSEQVAPKLRGVEDQQRHVAELKAVVSDAEGIYKKFAETTEKKIKVVGDKKIAINECETDHNNAVLRHKKRIPEIQSLDRQIKVLTSQHEQTPVPFDAPAFNLRIRDKDTAIRVLRQNAEELKVQEAAIKTRVFQANFEWENTKTEIRNMQTTAGQQGAKLRGASKDSATVYTWLQKNQNTFKDKIYGPPLIECTIKDPRFAGALEAVVSRSDLLCFTATNREDWKMFLDVCQNQLKVKDITVKVSSQALNHWKAPITKEELVDYGLEEFAIDLLQGPDPVLSMLCDSSRLHRTGMSLKDISDAQFNRLKDSPMNSWIAGRSSYRVNKRLEYGPDAVSTIVSNVKPARLWTNEAGVDNDAMRQLHVKMKDYERQLAEGEEELAPLQEQIQEGKTKWDSLEDEKVFYPPQDCLHVLTAL
jgi:chromosome segregation ATPase